MASELTRAIEAGDADRVGALLREGADPEAVSEHGVTALGLAAIRGQEEIVRLLLDASADPRRPIADHGAPVLASCGAHPEVVRLLLAGGADPNAAAPNGVNVFAAVIFDGDAAAESLRLLLEAGADPTVPNRVNGLCALDVVDGAGRELVVASGFDPDERVVPRLSDDELWSVARAEAERRGWPVPQDGPRTYVTRYTVSFELRPPADGGWTDEELERWRAADGVQRELVGIEVRDRLQRRMVVLDARRGEILGTD